MDFSPKICYHDEHLLLARKPHGIASSWGQEESFLDSIKKYGSDDSLRIHQLQVFGEQGEYGLLNRIDNVTAGLLYFARSEESKEQYLSLQAEGKITKIYYAQVYGVPRGAFGQISTSIYHHREDASRMTIDARKGRGKGQEVVTYWEYLTPTPLPDGEGLSFKVDSCGHPSLDDRREGWRGNEGEVSLLKIQIASGCRHQIRCHLASIGHPIVGDRLYMGQSRRSKVDKREGTPKPSGELEKIELISAGIEILGSDTSHDAR